MSANDEAGKVNQSLYFARLHCDSARQLLAEPNGQLPFARQQSQCSLEAAVECLYRALYFQTLALLKDDGSSSQLLQQLQSAPQTLAAIVKSYCQKGQGPELNRLNEMLASPSGLALLLQEYQAIWTVKSTAKAVQIVDISLTDTVLSLESCEQWMQDIIAMFEQFRASSAEY